MKNTKYMFSIVLLLSASINLTLGSTNDVVFANSYEKLTSDVCRNFKEEADNLRFLKTSDRALETRLWLQLLNRIDQTRDLDFNPQAPTNRYYWINAVPPLDEETVRANHQKALRSLFEMKLKNLTSSYTTDAVNYFNAAYAKTPSDAKELIGCLDIITDDKHKSELKQKLSDYTKLVKAND